MPDQSDEFTYTDVPQGLSNLITQTHYRKVNYFKVIYRLVYTKNFETQSVKTGDY